MMLAGFEELYRENHENHLNNQKSFSLARCLTDRHETLTLLFLHSFGPALIHVSVWGSWRDRHIGDDRWGWHGWWQIVSGTSNNWEPSHTLRPWNRNLSGATKKAQGLKTPATKPDNLNSVPRTHMMKRETPGSCPLASTWCPVACTHLLKSK